MRVDAVGADVEPDALATIAAVRWSIDALYSLTLGRRRPGRPCKPRTAVLAHVLGIDVAEAARLVKDTEAAVRIALAPTPRARKLARVDTATFPRRIERLQLDGLEFYSRIRRQRRDIARALAE